ncbi:MAG: DNA polymerase I [Acidobacteria bacterium]|nr:DNA polymerase I [Acidobacteriota bacterium]
MTSRPLLYLIDGSSQMYRAYHAPIRTAEGTLLRNSSGIPTNAVYIFVTMLRKLLKEHAPAHIAASFDLPGRTFRDDLSADYKANRAPMPDDLASQIPLVHRACEALGVPIVTHDRYEADDVIGTMAKRAVEAGYDVAIVTGDKDFFQLVNDHIRIYNPRDEGTWYDADGVKEKFGVRPDQVVDVLALMGDTIDNVKGVPGIGEKGARDLINTWGTLDALLEHAPEVTGKKYREALLAHRQEALDSRQLLVIHCDVPVPFDIEALAYRGPSRDDCYQLFSDLGFRSLTMEYAPSADTVVKDYALVTDAGGLDALIAEVRQAGRFALRVIPDQPGAMRAGIVGVAIATRPRQARYVPLRHAGMHTGPQLTVAQALGALKPLLEDAAIEKVGHDLKFDAIVLARHGVTLRGLSLDTMLASYLLDATRSGHPLEGTALEHLGYKALTEEDLCGRGSKATPFVELPPDGALNYAGERADLAFQLAGALEPKLTEAELTDVYERFELPLIPVLVDIERAGVRIDTPALAAQSQRIEKELSRIDAHIFGLAGEPFNIASPQQLSRILFDKLKLPALRRNAKTRTASTAADVLEELAQSHELPRLILQWRELMKLKGTYIDALPQLVNPETGRLHTCFNQAVAATGRLSSSDPNLQNIPVRTETGREIRRAIIADPGHVLISADYSQIEFRVLAHMADDPVLVEAFREGADFHERTALKIFGADSGRDPHDLRSTAKMVNYALLYGKTAFTLAKDIGVTPQEAQDFIDAYFAGFPRVRAFIDSTLEQARQSGSVKTLYGRRRLVPELNSKNTQIRQAAERETVNMPIQGTAADILKLAMIATHDALRRVPTARMILTVHDELLFEVAAEHADETAALVRQTMQDAAQLRVPLVVDVGIGPNWADAKR